MRDQATIDGNNLKVMVWCEACLKVCINMSADLRPLTLNCIKPILRDTYTVLNDGLCGQDELATNLLATKFQEYSDAVTKDWNNLKNTVLFKPYGRGRGSPRGGPRGRSNYRGGQFSWQSCHSRRTAWWSQRPHRTRRHPCRRICTRGRTV